MLHLNGGSMGKAFRHTLCKKRWLPLILSCLLLTGLGCSGGGSGGGNGGSDTTPPQVSSTSPLDGSTDVALSSAITATFNEAMDGSTITATSFSVDNGVTGTLSYNSSNHTATLVPAANLAASTTYSVTISATCTDAAGNAMAADHTFTFTTGNTVASGWTSLGDQVSPAGAESEDPTMLIVDDTPVVGYRHASFGIHLHQWDGGDWISAGADPSGGNAVGSIYHTPSFCSDGSTLYMAYALEGISGGTEPEFYNRVFAYKWTQSSGYSIMNGGAEVSIPWDAVDGGDDAYEPAVACLAGSNPWVAWTEVDMAPTPDSDYGLWVAQVSDSGVSRSSILSRNDTVASYATDVRTVGIAVDSVGTVYAAQWESHHSDQDRTDLYVSSYNGSSFSNLGGAVTDDYDYNNLCKPSLAVLGGDVYIAYTLANDTDYTKHVYVRRYNAGSWDLVGSGPVSAYSPTDHYDSANPDLIVANGVLYVAWQESDQFDGPFIYVAYYDTGSSDWVIDGSQLNVDTANAALDPSLAYHDDVVDYLYVAFEEYTDGWPHIFVKRKQLAP